LNPRQQPLQVSVDTKLIAVTRIESSKTTGERAALSEAQEQKLVSLVMSTGNWQTSQPFRLISTAASSEREFYRGFLQDLRGQLPDTVPLFDYGACLRFASATVG